MKKQATLCLSPPPQKKKTNSNATYLLKFKWKLIISSESSDKRKATIGFADEKAARTALLLDHALLGGHHEIRVLPLPDPSSSQESALTEQHKAADVVPSAAASSSSHVEWSASAPAVLESCAPPSQTAETVQHLQTIEGGDSTLSFVPSL